MTEPISLLRINDVYLFNEGTHARLYKHLVRTFSRTARRHILRRLGANAEAVSVVGDFNDWNADRIRSSRTHKAASGKASFAASSRERRTSFISDPDIDAYRANKTDPFGIYAEQAAAYRVSRLGPRLRLERR